MRPVIAQQDSSDSKIIQITFYAIKSMIFPIFIICHTRTKDTTWFTKMSAIKIWKYQMIF